MDPDFATWRAVIGQFIAAHVRRSGTKGVVVGMSGGVDSAVTAALAAEALGPENVLGVLLPHRHSDPEDERLGRAACKSIGIACIRHDISTMTEAAMSTLEDANLAGNVKARCRMTILYAEAQRRQFLVCGTGNKSELLVGYFTKWGDGGVDLEPIGDLWKTQVWQLGEHLGIPAEILTRPPTAGLAPGQTDEQELGMDYHTLDAILKCFELGSSVADAVRRTGFSEAVVQRVDDLVRRSEHKRHPPIVPKLGGKTVGIDWRRSVHWDA